MASEMNCSGMDERGAGHGGGQARSQGAIRLSPAFSLFQGHLLSAYCIPGMLPSGL